MILYHGSTVAVEAPRILAGVRWLDFGPGFYTTGSWDQARRWAQIKMRREQAHTGYVSVYEFDEEAASRAVRIRNFDRADENWLRFVAGNRCGAAEKDGADIHRGPVADDNVYATVRLFETHILSEEETVRRLKTETLHDQIAFHTAEALAFCRFLEARTVSGEE